MSDIHSHFTEEPLPLQEAILHARATRQPTWLRVDWTTSGPVLAHVPPEPSPPEPYLYTEAVGTVYLNTRRNLDDTTEYVDQVSLPAVPIPYGTPIVEAVRMFLRAHLDPTPEEEQQP
jgi:hypothetical protein